MLYVFRNFFCKICLKNAPFPPSGGWGAVVMAVAHAEFETLDISSLINGNSVVYDVKGVMENGFDGKL